MNDWRENYCLILSAIKAFIPSDDALRFCAMYEPGPLSPFRFVHLIISLLPRLKDFRLILGAAATGACSRSGGE